MICTGGAFALSRWSKVRHPKAARKTGAIEAAARVLTETLAEEPVAMHRVGVQRLRAEGPPPIFAHRDPSGHRSTRVMTAATPTARTLTFRIALTDGCHPGDLSDPLVAEFEHLADFRYAFRNQRGNDGSA